MLKWEATDIP